MKWTIPKIITVSALSGALLVGAAGGAYAMGATSHHAAAAASPAPVTKTVIPPKPKPTPAKTIYVQPVRQAPVQQAPPAPAPQQFTNSVAVVDQFYQDITDHNYTAAWALGGSNLSHGVGYESWVSGYSTTTASITLYDQTDWGSGTVHAYLSAPQLDGSTRTYVGTYTVSNGVIVSANITQTP